MLKDIVIEASSCNLYYNLLSRDILCLYRSDSLDYYKSFNPRLKV